MTSSVDNAQYDQISDGYSKLYPPGGVTNPDYALAIIEAHQLHLAATSPSINIKGKRVLDLASGSGHYAFKFLSWGAASVTCVDVSEGMLNIARESAKAKGIPESTMNFFHGDASDESLNIPGGPFDLVTGCWLLNYASNTPTMTKMWNFIARHLKPGGIWMGLTISPLLTDKPEEIALVAFALSPQGPWGKNGYGGRVLENMPNGDGYKEESHLFLPGGPTLASFENYHLRLQIFQDACEQSGQFIGLEWQDFIIPEAVKQSHSPGYWNDIALFPHCRVCIARRRE